jgi:hypothetical protein
MMEYRPRAVAVAASLREPHESQPTVISQFRSVLERAFVDSFDLLLRRLLTAAGGPHAMLLESALDVAMLRSRLESLCEGLPHSPHEEAMLEGKVEMDDAMEIRATVQAVIVDQLAPAMENLLRAARSRQPESPPEEGKR